MDALSRVGRIAAFVGGGVWVVKSLIITVSDANFQPLEGVMFFIGLGGILIGCLGLAAYVAGRWSGAGRLFVGIAVLGIAIVVSAAVNSLVQNVVASAYSGGNVGIEEEMGILATGVVWLIVGFRMKPATTTPPAEPVAA